MFYRLIIPVVFLMLSFQSAYGALSSTFYINIERSHSGLNLNDEDIRKKILKQYSLWQGVKYKFGGTTVNGIDCSSLMQQIFHAAFPDSLRRPLPRTTAEQLKQGSLTSLVALKPGDLLFFQMSENERHVGVYIGDEKFIHASTSKGVMISDLTNHYWKKRFKLARRVIS